MITYRQMSSVGLEEKRLTQQILLSGHETLLQKEQKGERRNVDLEVDFQFSELTQRTN